MIMKYLQAESESDDDLAALKTRSLVCMERNLTSPCDVSPIQPHMMREEESKKQGLSMEKLLLERVLLRKELKLRNMQERLLEMTQKLEEVEEKVGEYERMPGLRLLLYGSRAGREICRRAQRGASCTVEMIYKIFLFITCNIPSYLLHCLPSFVQVGCMRLVQEVARWVGDSVQNYDNECRERGEEKSKERASRGRRRR